MNLLITIQSIFCLSYYMVDHIHEVVSLHLFFPFLIVKEYLIDFSFLYFTQKIRFINSFVALTGIEEQGLNAIIKHFAFSTSFDRREDLCPNEKRRQFRPVSYLGPKFEFKDLKIDLKTKISSLNSVLLIYGLFFWIVILILVISSSLKQGMLNSLIFIKEILFQ